MVPQPKISSALLRVSAQNRLLSLGPPTPFLLFQGNILTVSFATSLLPFACLSSSACYCCPIPYHFGTPWHHSWLPTSAAKASRHPPWPQFMATSKPKNIFFKQRSRRHLLSFARLVVPQLVCVCVYVCKQSFYCGEVSGELLRT